MTHAHPSPTGAGLGFRLKIAEEMVAAPTSNARFIEVAPENYLGAGGKRARLLRAAAERWPVVSHGLCGDFAGAAPLDEALLLELKHFLHDLGAQWYSDHLCLTHADGVELHDLIPLPHSEEAVRRASTRIREVRERLELPIAVENVSAYARMPGAQMSEEAFVRAVVEEADCHLLLDVNNVYVNSQNFDFDPDVYIDSLPLDRVVQIHMAGHRQEPDGLLIDTHGAPIIDPVYALLERTLPKLGKPVPVLLERDHSIPPLTELEVELARLQQIIDAAEAELPEVQQQAQAAEISA
jgi:uncharacterized protein (UPF0276 family)